MNIKKYIILLFFGSIINTTSSYSFESNQLDCLVEAIYHEARSESFGGQLAVDNVILERVKRVKYPSTICEVVHAGNYWEGHIIRNKCSFSYYCDGKKEWDTIDLKALQKAYDVAVLALEGGMVESTLGATHYHASYVTPKWSYTLERLGQIGHHIFYVDW